MARVILFLIASVAISGVVIGVSGADKAHTETQRRSVTREALDDAVATVLDEAIHSKRRVWKSSSKFRNGFEVNGRRIEMEDYHLEEDGQVVAFTLVADAGGERIRQTSRYRIADPGWPSPLWVDAPYGVSQVDPRARVDGKASEDTRGVVFDATRFGKYRLGSVLNLADIPADLGSGFENARGNLAALEMHTDMASLLRRYKSPAIIDVLGKALNEFGPDDVRYTGDTVIDDSRSFGSFKSRGDVLIVHVKGDLVIGASGDVVGGGLLLVEGDLTVEGRLRWGGLVVVRTQNQHLNVEMSTGDVEIRGSLVVDQEAPPPGGHTDLTINRDLLGTWSRPYGEVGYATPGYATFGTLYPFYDHQHRIDHVVPEKRTFYFAERGRDRHEGHTWFRRTLSDIATRYPGEEIYIRFKNARNHGSAVFHLYADGDDYDGTVSNGFGGDSRQGDRWASPSFLPTAIDTFIVDVQSLRMLQHLVDGEEPESPFWPYPGQPCTSRPQCIGYFPDRDDALAVQIVRAANDAPLYEASIYWHTHPDGYTEHEQEEAADEAWRQSIKSGATEYGTTLRMGDDVTLLFENAQVARILARLGFNTLSLEHLTSYVETVKP